MKKISYLIVLLFITIFPLDVFAFKSLNDYNTMSLPEVLEQEGFDITYSDYAETNDQVTIYLFRGYGCDFCRSFISFLNNNLEEYGKYFKVVSFEIWNDTNNKGLWKEVANFTGEPAEGVPYIIIGKEVFPGYIEDWNQDIIDTILKEYESTNRYDVFEEMLKSKNYVVWYIVVGLVGLLIIVGTMTYQYNKLNEKLDEICEALGIDNISKKEITNKVTHHKEVKNVDSDKNDEYEEDIDEDDDYDIIKSKKK